MAGFGNLFTELLVDDLALARETFDTHELPPVIRKSLTDPVWTERFKQCFTDLATKVEAGDLTEALPSCTGEEMALHIALDLTEGDVDAFSGQERVDLAEDIELARELLFQDHDVLMLFDPQMDGFEDDSEFVDAMGVANLRADEWFLPWPGSE